MAEGTLKIRAVADTRQLQRAMKGVRGQMDRVGRRSMATGKTMTKGLTAPILGVGAVALKTAGDFESSMNRVKAVSGATGKDFKQLSGLARELGSSTQFSAGQAADAMGFLAQAGFETDDMMSALPGTLDLAAAGQLELAEAADIASNVLTGFGLKAEEIGRVNDTLAATASSANTNVSQMGEAFSLVAPVAASSGMEIEETSAIIGALGDAGIQASRAGTTLRGMIAALESPSAAAATAIDELGLKTHDASGELLPMTEIVAQLEDAGLSTADAMTIFGRRAGPGMSALVSKGSDELGNLIEKLEESGGTAERMAETQMEGLNGALARLKSALEGAAIAIAESGLIDKVANFAEKVAGVFQRVAEANPKLLRIGVIIAGVAAAIGPLLIVLGALATAVGAISAPIAIAVGAVVGLTAAFVTAWRKSETFRDIVSGAFDAVKNSVGPTIGWLGDRMKDIGDFFGITRTTVVDEVEEMSNKAVADTVDMTQKMTDQVRKLRNEIGGELSQEMADDWIANVNRMADKAIQAANEQYREIRTGARDLAEDLDTVTLDMAGDVVRNARQQRDKTIAANERARKEALEQIELLRSEGVKVTEKMANEIIADFERQRDEVVKAVADQERQARNVLSRLEAESGKISVRMASKAITQSARQRDKTVEAARQEYRQRVDAINEMESQSDEFTREMADDAIREARKQRDQTISAARQNHKGVVGQVKGMRDGVENEVNLMNGNVLSSWDKFWRDFNTRLNEGFSGFLIDSAKWLVSWDQESSESIGGTLAGWTSKFNTWFAATKTALGAWVSDSIAKFQRLRDVVTAVWERFWSHLSDRVSDWLGAIGSTIKGKIDQFVGWFRDLPSRIGSVGGLFGTGSGPGSALSDRIENWNAKPDEVRHQGVPEDLAQAARDVGLGIFEDHTIGKFASSSEVAGKSARERARAAMEGLPVVVTSGYRTPAENRAAGGDPNSFHLDKSNPAIDIGGPVWALDQVAARLREMGGFRELLWRTKGHFDHVHVAHEGGMVTPQGIEPLKADEVVAKLRAGETVRTREQESELQRRGSTTINQTFVTSGNIRDDAQAAKLKLMS